MERKRKWKYWFIFAAAVERLQEFRVDYETLGRVSQQFSREVPQEGDLLLISEKDVSAKVGVQMGAHLHWLWRFQAVR